MQEPVVGAVALLITMSLSIFGCSGGETTSRSGRGISRQQSGLFNSQFERLWEQRTVALGGGSGGRNPFLGPSTDGPGGTASQFPLTVRATLLDSTLVEAGIDEFSRLAGLNQDETRAYRIKYSADHHLDEYLFVEVEMQTFLSEDYLRLDRWVFFLEDESRNQFEPRRMEKDAPQRPFARAEGRMGDRPSFGGPGAFPFATQRVELYFPRYRSDRRPVFDPHQGIKLVVLDAKDPNIRAEGSWKF